MGADLGIFVLWSVAVLTCLVEQAVEDLWGVKWWRRAVIIVAGYSVFYAIAMNAVSW